MAPTLGSGATVDAEGTLWVTTVADGHIELRRSADGGHSFATPIIVNATREHILATGESHADVAVGPQGQIYVSWARHLPEAKRIDVRFARSLDGGHHFSTPITVNRNQAPVLHYFDALAVDGQGRVWLAWIDSRDAAAAKAKNEPYRGFAIYTAVSTDAGASFAAGRKLVDHSCECCRLALARTADGDIDALFRRVYAGDVRDHALATLAADRTTAVRRVTFSNWSLNACPDHGPALAIGADGSRHAVWYEAAHGPAIHYGKLEPDQPPRHAFKIAGAGAAHGDLAVAGQMLWVVWNQVDATGWSLKARQSRDGGTHFTPPRTLATSAVAVSEPKVVVRDGHALAVWNTTNGLRVIPIGHQP